MMKGYAGGMSIYGDGYEQIRYHRGLLELCNPNEVITLRDLVMGCIRIHLHVSRVDIYCCIHWASVSALLCTVAP